MRIEQLQPGPGSRKRRKRVGRGVGSGMGKTSTRGTKGQMARSNGKGAGFEGGQMPLIRRVPKRGFTNSPFRKEFAEVNLGRLEVFEEGTIVTPEVLVKWGIVKKVRDGVKILGKGDLTKALTVHAHRFSARAKERIGELGGKVEVLEG